MVSKSESDYMSWTRHHWTLSFFYCLLLALFVTVCIYVYAGEQQNLGARKFGNVNVHGLVINVNEWVTNTANGSTLSFNTDKTQYYYLSYDTAATLSLPSKDDILKLFPVKRNGTYVATGFLYNNGTDNITITVPSGITNLGSDVVENGETVSLDFIYQDGDLLWQR